MHSFLIDRYMTDRYGNTHTLGPNPTVPRAPAYVVRLDISQSEKCLLRIIECRLIIPRSLAATAGRSVYGLDC